LVTSHGLQQEFITPHCPEQIGLVEMKMLTPNQAFKMFKLAA
jgi:hypothetical protein